MGVLLKYALESILIAGSTAAFTRGQLSLKRFLLLATLSVLIFIVLDLFAPIKEVHVQLGGSNEGLTPDMCGGAGLVEALQDLKGGGFLTTSDEQVDKNLKFKNHPYKLVSGMYGAGTLLAGFNEGVYSLTDDSFEFVPPVICPPPNAPCGGM